MNLRCAGLCVGFICMMAMGIVSNASAEIKFGGYVRVRNLVEMTTVEDGTCDEETGACSDLEETNINNRVKSELKAEGSKITESGYELSAKAALIMQDGGAKVDDTWLSVKKNSIAFKFGRFEGEKLFVMGLDPYVEWAPGYSKYRADAARGRKNVGTALNIDLSDAVMFEVNTVYGNEDGNFFGARPVIKFDNESLIAKAGVDYLVENIPTDNDADGNNTVLGFGGNLEFKNIGNFALGVSGAYKTAGGEDSEGNDLDDANTLTTLVYMKKKLTDTSLLGAGFGFGTYEEDGSNEDTTAWTGNISYRILPFLDVEDLRLELSVNYASTELDSGSTTTNTLFGTFARLRYDWGGLAADDD